MWGDCPGPGRKTRQFQRTLITQTCRERKPSPNDNNHGDGRCCHDFSCWWLRLKSPARGSELSTSERVSASRGSAVLFSYGERGPHLDGLHFPAGHEHGQRSGCGGNEGRCACLTPAYISHAAACVPAPHAQAPAASTGPPLSHRQRAVCR